MRLYKLNSKTTSMSVLPLSKFMPDEVKAARSTPNAISAQRKISDLIFLM